MLQNVNKPIFIQENKTPEDLICKDIAGVFLIIVAAALSLWTAWIGYQGWFLDDLHYLRAAEMWNSAPPYIATTQWGLRVGFVLPLAAAIRFFGSKEATLIAVSIFYYASLLGVTYIFIRALFGRAQAFFSTFAVSVTPLLASWATTPRTEIAVAFYLTAAFWCILYVFMTRRHERLLMILAGVSVGCAWLTHELAIGFLLTVAVLCVCGWGLPRRTYASFFIAFFAIFVAELIFYHIFAHNLLYRIIISFHHGVITTSVSSGQSSVEVVSQFMQTSFLDSARLFFNNLLAYFDFSKISRQQPISLLHVNNWVDPYIQFFYEPYYGLTFLLGIPSALSLIFAKPKDSGLRIFLWFAFFVFFGSLFFMLYVIFLRPLPRYFIFPAYLFALIIGLALSRVWLLKNKSYVLVFIVIFLGVNLVCMESRRGLGLYNERILIKAASAAVEPIYTDVSTYRMSEYLLGIHRIADKVHVGVPPAGGLYFYNPSYTKSKEVQGAIDEGISSGAWQVVYEHKPRPKWMSYMLEYSGIKKLLPDRVVSRIVNPHGIVRIYRVE
jgi:4-amino-4-deoxy-L-arabinose transferase-like glycosyltransferase